MFGIGDITKYATQLAAIISPKLGIPTTAAQINALGLPTAWNASTNTPTLVSGTLPTANNSYSVTVAGTTNLDGITSWGVGDIAYFDGAHWQQISGTSVAAVGSGLQKGNGAGALAAAVAGVDYMPPLYLQCPLPIGIAPAGTVGSNGALTITGTALAITYNGPGIWLYFPANALTGSNAAGFYWTVMSSTTAGTVYNTTYTPGTNTGAGSWAIPSSPTAFSGTTGAAYTNATATDIVALKIAVPGNYLGKHGSITSTMVARCPSNANNKVNRVYFAGSGGVTLDNNTSSGTTISYSRTAIMMNRGSTGRQVYYYSTNGGAHASQTPQTAVVDTSVSQDITCTLNIANSADWLVYELARLEATPGPV